MRFLQIHNYYRYRGGEDSMFEQICAVLRTHGHAVTTYTQRSTDVQGSGKKLKAALTGVHSPRSEREVRRMLRWDRPDIAHVHNLYPLISPSVLRACSDEGIPIVMRCPNYRLVCPTGVLLRNGKPCELCVGGHEYRCALVNCRGNLLESTAIAGRSFLVRAFGMISKSVTRFIAPSQCVKQRLVQAGIDSERIDVVPNMVPLPAVTVDPSHGEYVAFAGRLSAEKGLETLLDAARLIPHVPVRIAGNGELLDSLQNSAPSNVTFMGHLRSDKLASFYAKARLCVVPSIWLEAFGLVPAEAMAYGLPVVASRMGALPEIVDHDSTGYLFEPGSPEQLAASIEQLWSDPQRCRDMGLTGREKVKLEYSRDVYYTRLMRVYEHVLEATESAYTEIRRTVHSV
ncbi:MAG: glycosyltransferase family 4 protein [Candidatus Hydrogenedentes bacterium]|nr:glycosyltransferase family 4 protein [Candidatus Hydrogenedentota bacterium]